MKSLILKYFSYLYSMKKKIIFLMLIFSLIITSGFSCGVGGTKSPATLEPITLKYWRVWDGPDAFQEIIDKYQAIHPNIKIEYRKLRYEEYERELLEAWAEERGPDIFSIHNTWVKGYVPKIIPLPESTKMTYQFQKGTVKKEIVTETRTIKSMGLGEIKNNFLDVVAGDVVIKSQDPKTKIIKEEIYGLPLSVDTLALYYNKDLFNNAGIPNPPTLWDRNFQQSVKKLTKQNMRGEIIQSGIAMGGSRNIERFSDVLSILMMQSGAQMMSGETVTFNIVPDLLKSQGLSPGIDALRFYTDFANPAKEVYSWNSGLDNSLEMFLQGNLAMMFGYSYHLPIIKTRAPRLNFEITRLPQVSASSNLNFANYWVEVVSRSTRNPDAAWHFLQFVAKEENVKSYLNKTKKPTALKNLIEEQNSDLEIGVFAKQLLTAKSWYKGKDSNAAELIMADMIDGVVLEGMEIGDALNLSARRIQQTIK